MKVLFIDGLSEKSGQVNLGLGYLAQYVRKRHDVTIRALPYHTTEELAAFAGSFDVVGFSSLTSQFRPCLRIAEAIRAAHPHVTIVFGGIHPTAMSEDTLREPCVDFVFQGEAEIGFMRFLDMLEAGGNDFASVPGLVYLDASGAVRKNMPEFVADLDEVGMPAWDLLERETTSTKKRNVITSRGCPYTCSYCYNSTMRRNFKFKYRRRGVASVIEECLLLRAEGADYINFSDDLFLVNREWLSEFARQWREHVGLPFSCTARPEMVLKNRVSLKELKDVGLRCVWVGIESGNEAIRRAIFNRKMSNEDIIQAFAIAKGMGLETMSFNLVGVPTEGWKEALDTFRINLKVRPKSCSHYTLMPYPDTAIWHMADAMGLFMGEEKIFLEDAGNVQGKWTIAHGYLHTGKLNRHQIMALRYFWRAVFPKSKWWRYHKRLRDVLVGLFWLVWGAFSSEKPGPGRKKLPMDCPEGH
ncbi:MAG: radical SAM protein [Desulfovibrionaceae bacterium]